MALRAAVLSGPMTAASCGIHTSLQHEGFTLKLVSGSDDNPTAACADAFDLFLISIPHGSLEWAENTLRTFRKTNPVSPVIAIAPNPTVDELLAIFRSGASDVLSPYATPDEIRNALTRLGLPNGSATTVDSGFPFGWSYSMRQIQQLAERAAAVSSTVLITGETGTGKELTARYIHQRSSRSRYEMVAINCSAIPEALLESELFGYEKGAFTGATRSQPGAFEMAHNGTIFLDEVGELAPLAQVKLLRALETKVIRPLGCQKDRAVDVRVIAATNQNLEDLVEKGKFRSDLYFRLNVVRLHLPPLRARQEDLSGLLHFHIHDLCRRMSRPTAQLGSDLIASFAAYAWPGNIRELRNMVESTLVHSPSPVIHLKDAPDHVRNRLVSTESKEQRERIRILAALDSSQWNKSRAARTLHCSRMTLYRKLVRHRIDTAVEVNDDAGQPAPRHRAAAG